MAGNDCHHHRTVHCRNGRRFDWNAVSTEVGPLTLARSFPAQKTRSSFRSGGEWHIGFPVISRASWGLRGGFFPLINVRIPRLNTANVTLTDTHLYSSPYSQRIILSVTWYSTQAWFGGGATKVVIAAIWPSFATMKNTLPASAHMETNDFSKNQSSHRSNARLVH